MKKKILNKVHILGLAIKYRCVKKAKIDVIDRFQSPGSNPTGLCYDGQFIWHCDADSGVLYTINPKTKKIVSHQKLPFNHPWGLTWDGEFLWVSDDLERKIYRINRDGNIVQSFNYQNMDIHELAWDGEGIWFVDWISKTIRKIDLKSGRIIYKIPAPSKNPAGLCYYEGFLWHTDSDLSFIYRIALLKGTHTCKIYKGIEGHQHDICKANNSFFISVRDLKCIYEVRI
jgi:streptogramin lyase